MKVPKDTLDIITSEVTGALKDIFKEKLHKVILYGSYARGDAGDESDIDIIAIGEIEDETMHIYRSIIAKVTSDLALEYEALISVVLQNSNEFEDYLPILPFFQNVMKDGIVLYAS